MTTQQKIPIPIIRSLVEIYYDFQDQRIITGNRIGMNSERNGITKEQLEFYGINKLMKDAEQFEKAIKALLEPQIKQEVLWQLYLSRVYGIGPILASGLIAYIGDIRRFERISDLWQYAGLGMNTYCQKCKEPTFITIQIQGEGKKLTKAKRLKPMGRCNTCGEPTTRVRQKRMVGYLSNWSPKFKVLSWKLGQSFLKQGERSRYYGFYNEYKKEEREKHPKKQKVDGKTYFNDGHLHNRALRKVTKLFLSHLWLRWREIEGLPVTEPYVGSVLGHSIIPPFTDKS